MENRKKRATTVLILFITAFTAVFALSFSARGLVNFSIHTMEENIVQRLIFVSQRAAEMVTAEELDQYQLEEDMKKPSYQALKRRLRDFAELAGVEYVYYIRPETRWAHYVLGKYDRLRFIIDNDYNEETRVGLDTDPYEFFEYPRIVEAMSGKPVCTSLGNYAPGWDGVLTAYTPIFDDKGMVAAVTGVDIQDRPIVNARKMLSALTAAQITVLLLIFIGGLFFLIRFRREAKNSGKTETKSPIKQRFMLFSTVFFLIILVVGTAVFIPAMRRIGIDKLEQRLNFAIQTMRLRVANEVNTEIGLAIKMADDPLIRRYFMNPADPVLQQEASAEIAAYRKHFKNDTIYWINDIDKIFYFDDGNSFPLDPDDPAFYWYNITLYETETYTFNINYNPESGGMYLFIDVPVFDKWKPVGMVGTGIDLSHFIRSVYRDLDSDIELYVFNSLDEITVARDQSLSLDKKDIVKHLGELGTVITDAARMLYSDDEVTIINTKNAKGAVSTFPLLGWYAAAFIPVTFASLFDSVVTTIFFCIIGVVLAIFIISNGFISVIQDTVDAQTRRLLELKKAAEDAARAKTAFLANTSHEIRTPMNAILGMAELILRKDIAPDVYEDAVNIKQAGTNLLAIINDILDFSKIESGKLNIIPAEYRFDSLINDVLSIIRMRLSEKRLRFITRIDGCLPSVLLGDEARVRQVLLNILSNAVKYTYEGEICLTVHAEGAGGPRICLLFEVSDTGVGIKPEDMDRLFGEFMQFDSHSNRGIEGTGLGLAISRNLCRLMGGDIIAESVYGRGSTFRATIPQQVKDTAPFAVVWEAGKKALIAEGRRSQMEALAYTAEQLGVSCSLAGTEGEMADLLAANEYHFVIASAPFYEQARQTLKAGKSPALLAFLPEFDGDAFPPDAWALPFPVHPLVLARFFNGETDIPVKSGGKSLPVKFTAPHARLLVVDDIATNLKVTEGLLAPYQATVDTCLSGADAVSLVKQHSYDIVFMDHMMPEMDGIEATALIREWEAAEQGEGRICLPIIALTANAILGMREMFLKKGFNDYLTKPIELAKLDELMAKWIPVGKREQETLKPGNGKGAAAPASESLAIAGLDVQMGIAMTGGNIAGYRQVLALFRTDAEERLPLLTKMPDKAGLPLLATQVHALKSAAASIGAAGLSALAARLEAAGKAGDMDLIQDALPLFTEQLAALAGNIKAALNTEGGGGNSTAAPAGSVPPLPPALLENFEEALRSHKIKNIERLLEELCSQPADGKTTEALEKISGYVLIADYEQALEILKTMEN